LNIDTGDGEQAASLHGRRVRGHRHGLSAKERILWQWNTEIASHSSVQGLLRVCKWHATQFTAVNAVTALNRIAKSLDHVAAVDSSLFQNVVQRVGAMILDPGSPR